MMPSVNVIEQTSFGKKICGLLAGLLLVFQYTLHAQEKDFTTWANVGLTYKVKPAFAVSGGLEWRTKDDIGRTDRWGMNIGGSYKPLSFLKLGAGYEVHYRNTGRGRVEVPSSLSGGRYAFRTYATIEVVVARAFSAYF